MGCRDRGRCTLAVLLMTRRAAAADVTEAEAEASGVAPDTTAGRAML
jgi:hypothetical protein